MRIRDLFHKHKWDYIGLKPRLGINGGMDRVYRCERCSAYRFKEKL